MQSILLSREQAGSVTSLAVIVGQMCLTPTYGF